MEELVAGASRRGRPPREAERKDEACVLRELLALVPQDTWLYLGDGRRTLVEAQGRLKRDYSLPAKRFCELLGIRERTFRSWKEKKKTTGSPESQEEDRAEEAATAGPDKDKTSASTEDSPERPKKKPDRSTGRFDLEVTLPGIQAVADTSDWALFGVPLKIVGVQDPGWRKKKLWESFGLHSSEDSQLVIETIEEAVKPGTQVVTDQGPPYMSGKTDSSLESLECEHAPQKEGAPTEKATKERAFRTVKDALKPIVELSQRIAERVPHLKRPAFAKAAGRILLSTFLRVYEAAPRDGGHPLSGRDAQELEAIAENQREKARAEGRSKRLLLKDIHQAYNFPGSPERFIRAHRNHALEDIQEAERRLRNKACRCRVKACDRYFAEILHDVSEKNRARRREERFRLLRQAELRRDARRREEVLQSREKLRTSDPGALFEKGLDLTAAQWLAPKGELLAGGRGLGTFCVRQALEAMTRPDDYSVGDRAEAVWKHWKAKQQKMTTEQLTAVERAFRRALAPFLRHTPSTSTLVSDKLRKIRPITTGWPPIPRPHLRN